MNGFEVAGLLRKNSRTRHIPIIFVTAISKEDRYVYEGYEQGAVDYLFKPLDPDVLRAKVSVFLANCINASSGSRTSPRCCRRGR